ncbi:hypothetical protein SNE25_19160 [Mucilaginibacter sabulilitoris]|uniref:PNPLA domain-containing protein n=1 Tax=Mucilaginibacter sabulilitoris TaxID=1173583 RepID=A0ABZ0TE10_9SPHI|nr:hypothetical protein [Mucilaginibacter sabulilitoris]WPU91440.1 hypothetical protein SNE25_19160 [Mucilaginibacter sabulilitoris]
MLLLTGFLIVGSMTLKDNYLIVTKYTPSGIINWEFNTSNAKRDSILKEWQAGFKKNEVYTSKSTFPKTTTGIETVTLQNNADYGFILGYVAILIILIIRIGCQKANPRRRVIPQKTIVIYSVLVIIAGVIDVFENILTQRALVNFRLGETLPDAWTISILAYTKYLLFIIVFGKLLYESFKLGKPRFWLDYTSAWLARLLKYSWRFRPVLMTLMVFFMGLFISDQVQDMLLSINTSRWASFYFLASITLLALMCWHLPKAIDNSLKISYKAFFVGAVDFNIRLPAGLRPLSKVDTGRLLGAAGFLIPATGILQTMNAYHIDYLLNGISPLVLLVASLIFYKIVLSYHWIERFYMPGAKVVLWRYWLSIGLLLFPMIMWGGGYEQQNREPYFLAYLSLDLFFLSVIFMITVTLRTSIPAIAGWHIAPWIVFSGLIATLFFILCNFPPFLDTITSGNRFYTMPIVICAAAGYLLFFSFLLFAGKKTGISLITFLLLFTLYRSISTITAYHEAHIQKQNGYHKSLDSLNTYTEQWLYSRKQEIKDFVARNPGKPYPVFFVNAYGGGIRATVWTTMVIGTLDSLLKSQYKRGISAKGFQHYVFSYSGASGGTIGLSLLCNARYQYRQNTVNDTVFYPLNSLAIYQNDYLTSNIVALLGRDMLASSLGIAPWADRARLMEQDWERHTHTHNLDMKITMGRLWKHSNYEVPLLFANTFDVDSGKKGITAPVILDSLDFPSTVFLEQEIEDPGDLRLSTAAFLSARFPYISPTAKLNGKHHFTDGGTWDNSGAETSLSVLNVFERIRSKLIKEDTIFNHIQPQFLSLPNSVERMEPTGKPGNLFEPLAPPVGILNSRVGYMKKSDDWNYSLSRIKNYGFYQFRPTAERVPNTSIWPVLPLGWQISDYAMTRMRVSILRDSSTINKVLARFGTAGKPTVKTKQ